MNVCEFPKYFSAIKNQIMGGSGSGGGGGLGGLLGGVTKLFGKKPAASEQQEAPQPTNPLEIMS